MEEKVIENSGDKKENFPEHHGGESWEESWVYGDNGFGLRQLSDTFSL